MELVVAKQRFLGGDAVASPQPTLTKRSALATTPKAEIGRKRAQKMGVQLERRILGFRDLGLDFAEGRGFVDTYSCLRPPLLFLCQPIPLVSNPYEMRDAWGR